MALTARQLAVALLLAACCEASILPPTSPPEAVRMAEVAEISYLTAAKLDPVLTSRGLRREVVIDRPTDEPGGSGVARSTFAVAARAVGTASGLPANSLVVAIRGSHTVNDWFTNAHVRLKPWGVRSVAGRGRLHQGFLAVARALLKSRELVRAIRTSPRVYLVGHSLGGAAAVIVAAHLIEAGMSPEAIRVFTFGAPMPGDTDFAKHYAARLDFYEYRNSRDPFFVLPTRAFFRHLCDERPDRFIWLTRGGGHLYDRISNLSDHHMWSYVYRMHGRDLDVISARFAIPEAEIELPFALPQKYLRLAR